MKKIFSTSLLVMLCCVSTLAFAQQDRHPGNAKTGSKHLNSERHRFDIEEDIRLMTLLTDALEQDGLIDKKNPYKLQIKGSDFYINDQKQTKEVRAKYQKYFRKDVNDQYTIQNDGDHSTSSLNKDDKLKYQPKTGPRHSDGNIQFDGISYQKSLQLMHQLITGLEKDGLLDSRKPYTLQVKEGELYINGSKQLKEVSDRFRKYFQSNNYALMND
jgi:hypothetical protein